MPGLMPLIDKIGQSFFNKSYNAPVNEIRDVAAAKRRASGTNDDEEDYTTSIWADVIPVTTIIGSFQPDERLEKGLTPSKSLNVWSHGKGLRMF
ncbi:hypothetical protein [Bartonella apis]|uniref:hypothetical protein n=1 Tax=Bartonella apis TaxID=1686310 RepID=UPI0011775C6B|nr:hypothetical protein [Bartonella apis]